MSVNEKLKDAKVLADGDRPMSVTIRDFLWW